MKLLTISIALHEQEAAASKLDFKKSAEFIIFVSYLHCALIWYDDLSKKGQRMYEAWTERSSDARLVKHNLVIHENDRVGSSEVHG